MWHNKSRLSPGLYLVFGVAAASSSSMPAEMSNLVLCVSILARLLFHTHTFSEACSHTGKVAGLDKSILGRIRSGDGGPRRRLALGVETL